jgi:hypothetical protein
MHFSSEHAVQSSFQSLDDAVPIIRRAALRPAHGLRETGYRVQLPRGHAT